MTEFDFLKDVEEELDKQFPKGKCKERGNALVLFAIVDIKFKEFIKRLKEEIKFDSNNEELSLSTLAHNQWCDRIITKLAGDDLK